MVEQCEWLAENLCGYVRPEVGGVFWTRDADDQLFGWRDLQNHFCSWQGAGEIVEAMLRKGFAYQMDCGIRDGFKTCEFSDANRNWRRVSWNSLESMPEAVIRAACKALGREDEQT